MIRPATQADMPLLLDILNQFHEQSRQPFPYCERSVRASLFGMMDTGCVLVSQRGAIGGVLGQAWANPLWKYACELFWWAEDGQGHRLLRGFEEWASEMGAKEVRMTTLAALPRAERLLERMNYEPTETSFGKVF